MNKATERKERTNWDYFLEGWNKAFDFDAIWNPEKYNNQDITAEAWQMVGESMYKAMAQIDRELKSQKAISGNKKSN